MRNKQYNLCVDMQHKGQGSKVGVAQCHKDNPSNGGEQVMFCCYFAKLCYRSVCTIKPELQKPMQQQLAHASKAQRKVEVIYSHTEAI